MSFALSPLQKSVDEAAQNSEKIIVQELATAINLAQSSPAQTGYKAFVPARSRDTCTIEMKGGIIKVTFIDNGKKTVVFSHYLLTRNDVTDGSAIDCRKEYITIEKTAERGGHVVRVT